MKILLWKEWKCMSSEQASFSSLKYMWAEGTVGTTPAKKDRRNLCNEEGATAVEFALSSVVMLAVIFGIVQLSLALYTYNYISDAAREGARYAIVRGSTSCLTVGKTTSTISDCNDTSGSGIVSYVQGLAYPGIDWSRCTTTCVTVSWPSTNARGNLVNVKISYPYRLNVPFVKPLSFNLSSSSAMVVQN
jgi:Flp pilus assembly protein TadG